MGSKRENEDNGGEDVARGGLTATGEGQDEDRHTDAAKPLGALVAPNLDFSWSF